MAEFTASEIATKLRLSLRTLETISGFGSQASDRRQAISVSRSTRAQAVLER